LRRWWNVLPKLWIHTVFPRKWSADQIIDAVFNDVGSCTQGIRPADDIALVVIKASDFPEAVNIFFIPHQEKYHETHTTFLSKMGIEVESVGNGVEALKTFNEKIFDLVLTDVQMPCMDGLTLACEIKRNYQQKPNFNFDGHFSAHHH